MSTCTHEEALNLFLDGELFSCDQADLFAHMAACETCREGMNAVMEFRRMSRQEVLHVPPIADEAVLARLELSRQGRFSGTVTTKGGPYGRCAQPYRYGWGLHWQ